MKNLKILFGIALIAAIIFASCGDPEPEVKTFKVTFQEDNGTLLTTKTVNDGGFVEAPAAPEGLYKDFGWYDGSSKFDFSTPITADITLKLAARITAGEGNNSLLKATHYLNSSSSNAGNYTLVLEESFSSATTTKVTKAGIKLTILGNGNTITLTGNGPLITFGKEQTPTVVNDDTITLTLDNVTLKGNSSNNNSVVWVRIGAVLTMKNGARVEGNTSSSSGGDGSSAVNVDRATFNMEGGNITGNTAGTGSNVVGGIYIQDCAKVTISGNSTVSGNNGGTPDILIVGANISSRGGATTLTLNGAPTIGEITLYAMEGSGVYVYPTITLAAGFTGSSTVTKINLKGGPGTLAADWVTKTLVTGSTAATLAKFSLGKYATTSGAFSAITTHKISTTGTLVAN